MQKLDTLGSLLQHPPATVFEGGLDAMQHCTSQGGIYLIGLILDTPVTIDRPTNQTLQQGLYLYAGSAKGPGGLKARIARHLRPDKKIRWHIDQLTVHAKHMHAWGWQQGQECDLIALLLQTGTVSIPVPRFGSSDCTSCPSHLVHWARL